MFAPTFSSRLDIPSTPVSFLTFNTFKTFSTSSAVINWIWNWCKWFWGIIHLINNCRIILSANVSFFPTDTKNSLKIFDLSLASFLVRLFSDGRLFFPSNCFKCFQVSWHFPSFSWKCVLNYFCFCLLNFDVTKLRKHLHELHRSWSFHLMANLCTRSLSLFSCRISFVNQPFVVH